MSGLPANNHVPRQKTKQIFNQLSMDGIFYWEKAVKLPFYKNSFLYLNL